MPASFADYDVVFECDAVGEPVHVNKVEGRDALNDLFEFRLELEVYSEHGLSLETLDQMLLDPARVAFDGGAHPYHGVLRSVEMLGTSWTHRVRYEVILVPRLWYATQTSGSWVYLDMSVPEIIRDVLKENGLTEGTDFEFQLTDRYVKSEYTLQYQETDLSFISRLMEHEGIVFFFTHEDGVDKLMMADRNAAFPEAEGHETIRFDPRSGIADDVETISSVAHRRVSVPRNLVLKDYNYRTPALSLRTGLTVDTATGHGTWVRYGDHFKDLASAKRIAKLRAEEIFGRRESFAFGSVVRGLRAGHKFGLVHHFVPDLDQSYVVSEIRHRATQYRRDEEAGGSERSQGYSNSFEGFAWENAYRPALCTARPRIYGFTQAKVDGVPADDGTTPIDPEGRYKVASVIDNTRAGMTQASRWVRRAQPYSGQDYGMHFPLHIGTEVMLAHVDGDPDRPVIVGTLANPENGTPVGQADSQRSRIRTRSNIVMGWHDRRG